MATQTAKSKLPDVQAPQLRRTIPNSQPLESQTDHQRDRPIIDQALSIQTYVADPYCSWQRGSNENFNGLLRQYIPKKRRMETVTDEELTMIENRLNHRPRKRLGFKTPHEVFHASLNRVAVRT
jgi:IS30 family transposase